VVFPPKPDCAANARPRLSFFSMAA